MKGIKLDSGTKIIKILRINLLLKQLLKDQLRDNKKVDCSVKNPKYFWSNIEQKKNNNLNITSNMNQASI